MRKEWLDRPAHRYKVPIVGGLSPYYEVVAPNKTMARRIAEGETHPWIHVRGKIIDLGLAKNPFEQCFPI